MHGVVGYFDKSQCVQVCPVDCIVPDPDHKESRDALETKFPRLTMSPV